MTNKNWLSSTSVFREVLDAAATAGVVGGCMRSPSQAAGRRGTGFDSAGQAKVVVFLIREENADTASACLNAARRELEAFDKAREEEKRARAEAEKEAAAFAAANSVPAAVHIAPSWWALLSRIRGWFRRKPVSLVPSVSRSGLVRRIVRLEARFEELTAIENECAGLLEATYQNNWARVARLPLHGTGSAPQGG